MCGLCGAVSVDRARPIERGLVSAMLERLAHRGPDGEGSVFPTGAALGHRRLAVIDLSAAAGQPLANEDGTILAVVNGEIYNHRELRKGLEEEGHRFRSRADVEVIVHLYEDHGPRAVERLEGMFALAIWDQRTETLLLARDTMGEKPLYYHESSERIVFASELGALLADSSLVPEVDEEALEQYLAFRFVPSPGTGLRGVFKLPPGHRMIWERGSKRIERYASIPRADAAREELGGSGPEAARKTSSSAVREAIARAVASRLESDVPVGVLLSGGLDSAIVAYEASRALQEPIRTFTVGFEDAAYDESAQAAAIARSIGSRHHALRLKTDLASELPRMVLHYGEPFADSSAAAVWFLAREVRRDVTVALGGDGGDELFGGYDRHRAIRLHALVSRWGGRSLVAAAARTLSALPLARSRRGFVARFESFARELETGALDANAGWLACFKGDESAALLGRLPGALRSGPNHAPGSGSVRASGSAMDPLTRLYANARDPLDDVFYADLSLALPDRLLFKVDVASMASALEVRAPFLDRSLVRLAMAIPSARKVGLRTGKRILREAYDGLLPPEVLQGRKLGFGLPLDRWLRGPLREMSRDLLLGPRAASRGRFDRRAVSKLLEDHATGAVNADDRIWSLMCLELWLREVVEGRARSSLSSHAVAS